MRIQKTKLTGRIITAILVSTSIAPAVSLAWYGDTLGGYIDVESYDHGGMGEGEVEYYDSNGEYHYGYLDIYTGGSGTITDYSTGEAIDVWMD